MAFVDLRVARLLERAQHQVAQNPLLRRALDAMRQLLIHSRRYRNVFRQFVGPRRAAGALRIAAVALHLDALDRQRAQAERVAKAGGQILELDHAARLRLFVDAIERGHAPILDPGGHAFVGGQHEFLDQTVGPGALGLGDAAHLALLVELDHRLGQVEVDRAPLLAPLVHPLEAGDKGGIACARCRVALQNRVDLGVGHARRRADHAFDNFVALQASGGVELHDATQNQPVLAGAQAANAAR